MIYLFIFLLCSPFLSFGMQHDIPLLKLTASNDSFLDAKKAQELSSRILQNPTQEFSTIRAIEKECNQDDSGDIESLETKLTAYRQKHPLFLLTECDTKSCDLNRQQSSARSFYEQEVTEQLLQQSQNNLNLVSFASGGLFPELVILTKFFKQAPNKNVHIVCIDHGYIPFIALCNAFRQNNLEVSNSLVQQIYTFADITQRDFSAKKEFVKFLLLTQHRFKQFVSYVNSISNNKCKVTIFGELVPYLKWCKENPEMAADVLTAIDFQIGPKYFGTVLQYYRLLLENLKKNGVAVLADNQLNTIGLSFIDLLKTQAALKVHTKKEQCSKERIQAWLIDLSNHNIPRKEFDFWVLQRLGMISNPDLINKFKEIDNNGIVSMELKTSKKSLSQIAIDNSPKIIVYGLVCTVLLVLMYDQLARILA